MGPGTGVMEMRCNDIVVVARIRTYAITGVFSTPAQLILMNRAAGSTIYLSVSSWVFGYILPNVSKGVSQTRITNSSYCAVLTIGMIAS